MGRHHHTHSFSTDPSATEGDVENIHYRSMIEACNEFLLARDPSYRKEYNRFSMSTHFVRRDGSIPARGPSHRAHGMDTEEEQEPHPFSDGEKEIPALEAMEDLPCPEDIEDIDDFLLAEAEPMENAIDEEHDDDDWPI